MAENIDKQWKELTYEQFKAIVLNRAVDATRGRNSLRTYYACEGVNKVNVGGRV